MTKKSIRDPSKKIFPAKKLASLLKRKRGKTVFTNGCFDLLHRGHASYLYRAKKQGDLLVVALNSDQSVRKIKGPSRPLNSLRDRMHVIASLEAVDYVTWFAEPTPLKLILLLKPHILVKGGDWKPKDIVGSNEVKDWGGTARAIRYIQGYSTTQIIKKSKTR